MTATDDGKRHTDQLIREIHDKVSKMETGLAVNRTITDSNKSWLEEHEEKLDEHAKAITKTQTIFGVVAVGLGMLWAGLLAFVGWVKNWVVHQ